MAKIHDGHLDTHFWFIFQMNIVQNYKISSLNFNFRYKYKGSYAMLSQKLTLSAVLGPLRENCNYEP